jgi:nickel transport protein
MKLEAAVLGAAALLLAHSPDSVAHDAWIEIEGPGHAIRYGHPDKIEAYDSTKVKGVAALDERAKPVKTRVETSADHATVMPGAPASLLLLDFDNGYWSKTADGWKNKPRTEVSDATESSHSLKFGKTVLVWGPAVTKPTRQRLEIVPLSARVPREGESLAVQVLFEGKPLAGASIGNGQHDKENPLSADAAGKASLAIHKGTQMIVASHKVALDRPEAEKESLAANLRFNAQ